MLISDICIDGKRSWFGDFGPLEKYGEASFQCCVMLIDSKFGDLEMLQKLIGMIYRIVRFQRAVYMLNGFLELYLR